MQSAAKTPQDYISALPEDRRTAIAAIDAAIRSAAPKLRPHMLSGMLAYGDYHYQYASGREGDWCVVALASQKNYISLYICAADEQGYLAQQNAQQLGKVSCGKSCIRFKKLEDLNLKLAMQLVKKAEKLLAQGKFAM